MKISSELGAKEFHEVYDKVVTSEIFSILQLEQICKDVQMELNRPKGVRTIESVGFFARYYFLDWDCLQLRRLAKFVKRGLYREALRLYNVK